jgi:hypothetical protein
MNGEPAGKTLDVRLVRAKCIMPTQRTARGT